MGRRKIEVRKIEDKNKCVATFRKRRNGLFKKALELHRLTGAEITLTLVYNKSRYCFNSHSNTDDRGNSVNTFHYNKHFQFKACGSNLLQGCSETNCLSKLSKNSYSKQKNETPIKLNSFPVMSPINNCAKSKYNKTTKLTSEERLANLRHIIVDELFKRALRRFCSLTKVSGLNKKESIITPCYSSSSSQTMLSPSCITPTHKISSSHLVNQSEKVFNDENILPIIQMYSPTTTTNSSLFDSNNLSLQYIYYSLNNNNHNNNLSYSSSSTTTDQQLSKEFDSSPLSQILEFIDENNNNTGTNTTINNNHDNDQPNEDNINNSKEYLDLDNDDTAQSSCLLTGLQTPNIICYLDEPVISYYSINNSSIEDC